MLLGILDTSLLGNLLTGKRVFRAANGVVRAHPPNNIQMPSYFQNNLNQRRVFTK